MGMLNVIAGLNAQRAAGEDPPPSGNFLIASSGQSNDIGYGDSGDLFLSPFNTLVPTPDRTFQRVYMFDPNTNLWKKLFYNNYYAQEALDNGFGWLGVGADIGLAQRWEQETTEGLLFIFKDGLGATSIDAHMKGQTLYTQYQTRYAAAQAAAITQGLDVPTEVTAFYWDQGETPGANPTAYETQFAQLIEDKIADDLIQDTTKILMVNKLNQDTYQRSYVASNPLASIVEITGATYLADALHYDTMFQFYGLAQRAYNIIFDTTGTLDG